MERYYIDTCIWFDYLENRSDRFRPLGEWALAFLKKIISENGVFIISDQVKREFLQKYSEQVFTESMSFIPDELVMSVTTNIKQSKKAIFWSKEHNIPYCDALHAVLSCDLDAVLITRDKHFFEVMEKIRIYKPEDLI